MGSDYGVKSSFDPYQNLASVKRRLDPLSLILKTLDSIAKPCSVNAYGRYFEWRPRFKIPKWNLKNSYFSVVS